MYLSMEQLSFKVRAIFTTRASSSCPDFLFWPRYAVVDGRLRGSDGWRRRAARVVRKWFGCHQKGFQWRPSPGRIPVDSCLRIITFLTTPWRSSSRQAPRAPMIDRRHISELFVSRASAHWKWKSCMSKYNCSCSDTTGSAFCWFGWSRRSRREEKKRKRQETKIWRCLIRIYSIIFNSWDI